MTALSEAASSSLSAMLMRKKSAPPPLSSASSGWERENTRDVSVYSERLYVLPVSPPLAVSLPPSSSLRALLSPEALAKMRQCKHPRIEIPEKPDFIGTRIWDCATLLAKLLEHHAHLLDGISESNILGVGVDGGLGSGLPSPPPVV